jgi:hypothetical protein
MKKSQDNEIHSFRSLEVKYIIIYIGTKNFPKSASASEMHRRRK